MGRFGVNDADNYGSSGGSSFFQLKDDGDIARVRFMYNNAEDISGYAVHEVTIDGKRRYVNCLRAYNEPKSKCPFCEHNSPQKAKLYVPLYDIDEGEVKIWERGKNFLAKLSAICTRYSSADTPLVAHTFEIERHGKKGDTQTTYDAFETGQDNTTLEDLPEIPEVLGQVILDKTADEMRAYLETGYFPNDGAPTGRSNSADAPVTRRTPATSRRSSEVF
jgi:hypothetical protein